MIRTQLILWIKYTYYLELSFAAHDLRGPYDHGAAVISIPLLLFKNALLRDKIYCFCIYSVQFQLRADKSIDAAVYECEIRILLFKRISQTC